VSDVAARRAALEESVKTTEKGSHAVDAGKKIK
jgi:hypothetical protein